MDKGTVWQLRNLIHHMYVCKDPSKNVKACEDFLEQVITAFLVHATTKAYQLLCDSNAEPTSQQVAEKIVSSFTTLTTKQLSYAPVNLVQIYSKEV